MTSIVFPPDGVSTAQLLGEIASDLVEEGVDVQVITTSPHYVEDPVVSARQPIRWRFHRLTGESDHNGARVTHIRMPKKAAGGLQRTIQWTWFHLMTFAIGAKRRRTFDVQLTVSPPPTGVFVCAALRALNRAPVTYVLWELYPDLLVGLGNLNREKWLYRLLKRLEKLTYQKSDAICCLHSGMQESVTTVDPTAESKASVIPTFADTDFLLPSGRSTKLRAKYSLGDSFVVGYAGNLGNYQDLSVLLDAAETMVELQDVKFLISGEGANSEALVLECQERGLTNVQFTGQLPYAAMPELYATADISVVTLAPGLSMEVLPSKTYRIMSCGRPILAVCKAESPLAQLVTGNEVGYLCSTPNGKELAQKINEIRMNPHDLELVGQRARALAEDRFSRAAVTSQYLKVLELTSEQSRESRRQR